MKVAIVDDEVQMTDQIYEFLQRIQVEDAVSLQAEVFHSGDELLADFQSDRFDLILLDVEMPGKNGIETAKCIRKVDDHVILMFITNMAQYAIHGYEVEALDYVLKPITFQDFSMKLQKALRYIKRNEKQHLILNTSDGKVPITVSDIYYIEVIRHNLVYHTKAGVYETRGVMREQEKALEDMHFARCNQSYLVNLAYVKAIRGNDVIVEEEALPISRNKKSEFLDTFAKYVGGL